MREEQLQGIEFKEIAIPPGGSASEKGRGPGRMRRALTYLIVIGGIVAAVGFGAQWGRYRYQNVVSTNATVKGVVAQLGARLDGVVVGVDVEPGQRVRSGEVLARLEDRHFQADLLQARSQHDRDLARLSTERLAIGEDRRRLDVQVSRAQAQLEAQTARLEAARSRLERDQKEYVRISALDVKGIAAGQELNDVVEAQRTSQALMTAAGADRDAAELALSAARIERDALSVREANLKVLEAQVGMATAAIASAEADIDAMVIRAPQDGWIVRRIVEPGGSVRTGQPVISMRLAGRVWVEAWIDEAELPYVGVGSPVIVSIEPFMERALEGTVQSIGALTDNELEGGLMPKTRRELLHPNARVSVRVALIDPPDDLIPGMSAAVGIPRRTHAGTESIIDSRAIVGRPRNDKVDRPVDGAPSEPDRAAAPAIKTGGRRPE